MSGRVAQAGRENAQDIAAGWFARWRSGQMTEAELAVMEAWLGSDAGNREAFTEITGLWDALEPARRDPGVMALRERAKDVVLRNRVTGWGQRAAAVLAIALLGFGATRWMIDAPVVYSTQVGQTSTVGLSDGSRLILDTNSAVKVWPHMTTQRRLELVRGRAFFQVAKDRTRPFIVRTDRGSVTAVGTAFEVRKDSGDMKVVLVEGRVRIQPSAEHHAAPVEMAAGYQFVADGANWRLSKADSQSETSWTRGQLIFDEQPLSDIVNEINRYTTEKITIADPQVGRERVSAVLKTDDVGMFLTSLETLKVAQARHTGEHQVQLVAIK